MGSDTIRIAAHPVQRTPIPQSLLPLLLGSSPPSQSAILLRIPPHLPPRPLSRQKGLLPGTQNTVPLPPPLALNVPRRDMLHGAIVPDGDVAGRLPPHARLDVVVLGDEVLNHGHESLALVVGDALETAAVHAAREHGIPARDGVGPDGWVDGVEAEVDVCGRAARALVGTLGAAGFGVVRVAPFDFEVLEELLEGLAHPVVEIVGAGVQGVSARVGDLAQAQGGVVAGVLFE